MATFPRFHENFLISFSSFLAYGVKNNLLEIVPTAKQTIPANKEWGMYISINVDETWMSSARNMLAKSLCCNGKKHKCVLRDRKRHRICLQALDKPHFITNQNNARVVQRENHSKWTSQSLFDPFQNRVTLISRKQTKITGWKIHNEWADVFPVENLVIFQCHSLVFRAVNRILIPTKSHNSHRHGEMGWCPSSNSRPWHSVFETMFLFWDDMGFCIPGSSRYPLVN